MTLNLVAVCLIAVFTAYVLVLCLQRTVEIAGAHNPMTMEAAREMMKWFFTGFFAVLVGGLFAFFQYLGAGVTASYQAANMVMGFDFFCGIVSYIILPLIGWLRHP